MPKGRILVVDDEPNARAGLRTILTEEGFVVSEAADGVEALERLRQEHADLVLADIRMPRMDGVMLVQTARKEGIPASFVMMTAFASIETAVEAMRAGAENFLVKPLEPSTVLVVLEKVLEKQHLARDAEQLRDRIRQRYRFDAMVGESAALHSVFEVVKRAAPTKATVLLLGESGTGKELVAQASIRSRRGATSRSSRSTARRSRRTSSNPSSSATSGGLHRGRGQTRRELRARQRGHPLPGRDRRDSCLGIQVKLLRVLQQREFERVGGTETLKVDVRVVAATNRDLAPRSEPAASARTSTTG